MSKPPIPKDENNYYHPETEKEIISLVNYARHNRFQVRVRGSGHSMAQAIFTDKCELDYVDVLAKAPDGDNVNIMLDKYTKMYRPVGNFVTVEAGIHLGRDPNDPLSTLENSFLYQLHNYGLAVDDLGGISHQTVAGFLSTGSSGGSLSFSVHENIHALRFVDGNGDIFEVSQDDENQDNFNAAVISLGLFGVLSKVTFRCIPKYNISGSQVGTLTHEASVDIFDDKPDDETKKGLTPFLKETQYTRILWWPQSSKFVDEGKDRVQVWQAERIPDTPDFKPDPFKLFDNTEIMMIYSFAMTLMGNIEDMDKVCQIAESKEDQFKTLAVDELMQEHGMSYLEAKIFANLLHRINTEIFSLVTAIVEGTPLETRYLLLPHFTAFAIKLLNMVDQFVTFKDYWYTGLPMDNSADDILVPVMWTEMWVPLSYATKATSTIRDYFKEGSVLPKDLGALQRTGNNAWELYASKPSSVWLSMSYSDGNDKWKDGAFRVDPFWFMHNSVDFRAMYRPIWLLFKREGIPFRLHWGKSFPKMDDNDLTPTDLVSNQYPCLGKFRDLRKKRDPAGIFLNDYWRHWLQIK